MLAPWLGSQGGDASLALGVPVLWWGGASCPHSSTTNLMPPLPAARHKENSWSTLKDGKGTLGPAGVPSQLVNWIAKNVIK